MFVIDLFALPNPSADLAPLFAALSDREIVGHLLFDLRFLAPLGFVPGRAFDTLIASQVLHADDRTAEPGSSTPWPPSPAGSSASAWTRFSRNRIGRG